jgi:hypothetical protein
MASKDKANGSDSKREARGRKRPFEEDGAWDVRAENPTIGQQTSFIGNKLVRSERYAKLKHKKKVTNPTTIHALAGLSCVV